MKEVTTKAGSPGDLLAFMVTGAFAGPTPCRIIAGDTLTGSRADSGRGAGGLRGYSVTESGVNAGFSPAERRAHAGKEMEMKLIAGGAQADVYCSSRAADILCAE
jgi:hypothetical protein